MASSISSSSSSEDSDYLLGYNFERKPKCYKVRITEDFYTEEEFKKRFRFSKAGLTYLESLVENDLRHLDNRGLPLTVKQKILIALRFYATGCFQIVSGDLIGISQSTVCYTVHEVSKAFARLAKKFIVMPPTAEERQKSVQKFYNIKKMPRCIGCIDGYHIPIKSPGGDNAEIYRNRKGFYSINVQAICDADCKFIDLVARWHGSAHDQTIFNFSSIKQRFESGEFSDNLLIGDGGYGCKEYLITPYRNPNTFKEISFNKALCSTRVCIERAFGIWKRRFSVLAKVSQINLDHFLIVIVAVGVLHNIAIDLGIEIVDDEEFQESVQVAEISPNRFECTTNTTIRDLICDLF